MRTLWKWTVLALVFTGLFGCRSDGRLFPPAGTAQKQRFNATVFDPYAGSELGPEVVGAPTQRLSEATVRIRQESPVPEGVFATLIPNRGPDWFWRRDLRAWHRVSSGPRAPGTACLGSWPPSRYDGSIVPVRSFRGAGAEPQDDSDAVFRRLPK